MITIIAKRWFQRSYGNTYHSCYVYRDGKLVGSVAFAYGYGNSYMQTAHRILQEAGIYPVTGERFKDYCDFLDSIREMDFVIDVSDVGRKKDL